MVEELKEGVECTHARELLKKKLKLVTLIQVHTMSGQAGQSVLHLAVKELIQRFADILVSLTIK